MYLFVKNVNWSLCLCLNLLKLVGFLVPRKFNDLDNMFALAYWFFWFMFIAGIYIIIQIGELIQVWGDLPLMISTSFLLFTNMAFGTKIVNVLLRKEDIQRLIDQVEEELTNEDRKEGKTIIKNCDKETTRTFYVYMWLSGVTVFGWASSADKGQLPLNAWYPYDTSKSPAYELTYFHQVAAVVTGATLNVCLDTLVTSLIALCRCRLKLLALSLKTLGDDLRLDRKNIFTAEQEKVMVHRLRDCVLQHQSTLASVTQIQKYFSIPIVGQFAVSYLIICITAYQLAIEVKQHNTVRVVSMVAYLLSMITQVFLYCYQGHQLADESSEMAYAAYECPWYACSTPFRRSLLLLMLRSRRVAQLTVGGLTTLSLTSFMSLIKASYTFFTVLQSAGDLR